MAKHCNHPECQDNMPPGNWGWQRCLFAELTLQERKLILYMRGVTVNGDTYMIREAPVLTLVRER